MSRLAAVIDLGPAVAGSPEEIAAVAERMRPGNGASVLDYVRDLDRAFAIPILRATEYPGPSAEELRTELGAFHPPQGYVRLARHPAMMAVCEKVAAESPVRSITVDNRLYRFRCRGQRPSPGGGRLAGWIWGVLLASRPSGSVTSTGARSSPLRPPPAPGVPRRKHDLDAREAGQAARPAGSSRAVTAV